MQTYLTLKSKSSRLSRSRAVKIQGRRAIPRFVSRILQRISHSRLIGWKSNNGPHTGNLFRLRFVERKLNLVPASSAITRTEA
jgi:hypothetical protein